MCIRPITVKINPSSKRLEEEKPWLHSSLKYAQVPCGTCPECLYKKQGFIVQRVQMESLTHDIFFCTLTYSEDVISTIDVNGYIHKYADKDDVRLMMKRLRKKDAFGRPFRYIAVSEYGGTRHRPHWHILFFIEKDSDLMKYSPFTYTQYMTNRGFKYSDIVLNEWCRNIGSTRSPKYIPLCRPVFKRKSRNYDFHYVNPYLFDNNDTSCNVAYYITKYVLKFDDWIDKKRFALYNNLPYPEYQRVWKLLRPRCLMSHHIGINTSACDYIRKNISYSYSKGYFTYADPSTGNIVPLSPYFKKYYCTVDDLKNLYYAKIDNNIDFNIYSPLDDTRKDPDKVQSDYKKRCGLIKQKNSPEYLDF